MTSEFRWWRVASCGESRVMAMREEKNGEIDYDTDEWVQVGRLICTGMKMI
jgi:hypothetical protein